MAVSGEEEDERLDQLGQHCGGEVTQIAQDQIAGVGHLQDVWGSGLVIACETRKGDVLDRAVLKVADPLDLESGKVLARLVAGAGEEFSQVLGQRLGGAVLDQDANERFKGLAGAQSVSQWAKQDRDDLGEKGLDVSGEAFAQGLFGVGGVGGQADDIGHMLQGEVGFGSDCQEAFEKIGHGDFTRGTFQEAGGSSDGVGVEVLEFIEAGQELFIEGFEETGSVSGGKCGG